MNESQSALPLLLALSWPLLLAVTAAFRMTHPLAVRLLPWGALPALATVLLPDSRLPLGDAMLGGALVLDATGRVFLLLISLLWLVTGVLARPRLHAADSGGFAVLLSLAMTGGLGMALAGDALLFYAATTLAGYALYGVLVYDADAATRQAGRVLVILLVVSDLLLFELLLMLGKTAAGMEFAAFRQAFLSAESHGMMLVLLVTGFGMKMGLLGMHFWLPRVFITSGAALRPALVAYLFGGGLLGAVRLLPLGEIAAPGAGEVLWWLAWLTLAYSGVAGLLQAHCRSVIAYATVALGGLWLAVLSALLQHPGLWQETAETLAVVVLQAGFALAALLLLATSAEARYPPRPGYLVSGVCWLAVGLLATAAVSVAGVITESAAALPVHGAVAVIAILTASSQVGRATTVAAAGMPLSSVSRQAAALTLAALAAAVTALTGLPLAETGVAALIALASVLLAVLGTRPLVTRLPPLPPGDLWVCFGDAVALAHRVNNRMTAGLRRGSDRGQLLARRLRLEVGRIPVAYGEGVLRRWPVALVLALLLGLLMGWSAGWYS